MKLGFWKGWGKPFSVGIGATGGSGAVAWTPENLTGYVEWVDPRDLSGNDGDAVASIAGKAGNTFAQADNDKKPLLKKGINGVTINGVSGQNVLRFDGSNDLMVAPNFLSGVAGTVIGVYRLTSALVSSQTVVSSGDEAGTTRFMTFVGCNTAANPWTYSIQRNNDTADDIRGDTLLIAGTVYTVIWRSSGTAYTVRINGTSQTLTVNTGANNGDWWGDTSDRDNVVIGALKRTTEANFLKGDLAGLVFCNQAISDAECALVEGFFLT